MPEQQQATMDPAAWEAEYKKLQADYTKKSQQLAEIERAKSEGKLLEKETYDDYLIKWASENPEAALEVFPALRQHVLGSGDANGKAQPNGSRSTNAFDEAIFDESSTAHQEFRRKHGDEGYRRALMSKMAPELLEVTGLTKELAELRDFKKSYESDLESLRERVDRSEKYAISSFDQVQMAQDPRRKQIRDLQEKLTQTKGEAWYEVIDKLKKLEEMEAKSLEAQVAAAATAAQAQQTQAPSPDQLAARIDQSNVVPQGAGSGSGQLPSQAIDPFEAAVRKADPAVADRLGFPSAA